MCVMLEKNSSVINLARLGVEVTSSPPRRQRLPPQISVRNFELSAVFVNNMLAFTNLICD